VAHLFYQLCGFNGLLLALLTLLLPPAACITCRPTLLLLQELLWGFQRDEVRRRFG
jgi:hypothetical protein